jgi:hypothetical protein
LTHALRHDAGRQVGDASGAEGHHDLDRLGRPVLRIRIDGRHESAEGSQHQ